MAGPVGVWRAYIASPGACLSHSELERFQTELFERWLIVPTEPSAPRLRQKNTRDGGRGVQMWTALLNELREIVVLASIIGGLLGVSVGLAAALAVIV